MITFRDKIGLQLSMKKLRKVKKYCKNIPNGRFFRQCERK